MDGLVHVFTFLSAPVISESQLEEAQEHLVSFSKQFSELFGETAWKPNQHFCFHLVDDIRNYGPLHVFQLFAMEVLKIEIYYLNSYVLEIQWFHARHSHRRQVSPKNDDA